MWTHSSSHQSLKATLPKKSPSLADKNRLSRGFAWRQELANGSRNRGYLIRARKRQYIASDLSHSIYVGKEVSPHYTMKGGSWQMPRMY